MMKMKKLTMALVASLAIVGMQSPAFAKTTVKGSFVAGHYSTANGADSGCLAWDSVYETAGAAMSDWAFYGMNAFCGEPTLLERSKGVGYYSSSSRPSMQQCINHVNISSYDRDRLVEYLRYETWEMRRRGQNNKWVCKVYWTIMD